MAYNEALTAVFQHYDDGKHSDLKAESLTTVLDTLAVEPDPVPFLLVEHVLYNDPSCELSAALSVLENLQTELSNRATTSAA